MRLKDIASSSLHSKSEKVRREFGPVTTLTGQSTSSTYCGAALAGLADLHAKGHVLNASLLTFDELHLVGLILSCMARQPGYEPSVLVCDFISGVSAKVAVSQGIHP